MKLQLNWGKVLEDLTYRGFKVFLYCWLNKEKEEEWTDINFTTWLGSDYKKGKGTWEEGLKNLILQGYLIASGGKITWNKKKILDIVKIKK